MLTPEDVVWEPYSPEAVATRAPAGLSSHCSANVNLWLTTAVLVYDIAVEAYCPGESGDVWAAPGVSGAHRVGACQSPGPQVIMNELGSYIRVESNDSSSSTFVGCQGVACRAQLIGSPRFSRGWTNGNRQTSTWSIQQDHTQTSPLGLTSRGTYPRLELVWFMLTLTHRHTRRGLRMVMPATTWRN